MDRVQSGNRIPFLREGVEAQLPISGRGIRAPPRPLVVQNREGLERGDAIQRHDGLPATSVARKRQDKETPGTTGRLARDGRGLSSGPRTQDPAGWKVHQRLVGWLGGGCLLACTAPGSSMACTSKPRLVLLEGWPHPALIARAP